MNSPDSDQIVLHGLSDQDLHCLLFHLHYHKIPKFSETRKHCCNLPKIQTKAPNLREFHQKGANGVASSENPDQTASI